MLENILIEHCGISATPEHLRHVVESNRFTQLSGGRAPGQEDLTAHYRKGAPGDWRNYFSERITAEFKNRFAELLVQTGYEEDEAWGPDEALAPPDYGMDLASDYVRVSQERSKILAAYGRLTAEYLDLEEDLARLRAATSPDDQ
jgi:hypothetical protein